MFSSNQRFEVSGDTKRQLEDCIDFAMKMANFGSRFDFRTHDLVFQKINGMFGLDGVFCLGSVRKDDEDIGKWQRFQFDFDIELVAGIVWQFLQKQDYSKAEDADYDGWDGSTRKGFVMRALDCEGCYKRNLDTVVDKMYYGFVYFEPFNSFYSK